MAAIKVERIHGPARRAILKGLVAYNTAAVGKHGFKRISITLRHRGAIVGGLSADTFFSWMFIALFADVFRRDISGWAKAGWIILMVIFPFIGILAYLIARPKTEPGDLAMYQTRPAPQPAQHNAADEIAKAAELQDQGRITAAEYERIKQHALSY